MPNYRITVTDDPHELIRQSAVVIAFQSTTMLEAALAARPVVVPLFAEALRADHQPYLRFRDAYHLFLTAGSADKMKALVQQSLQTPRLAEEGLDEKRDLFEKYVSKLSADSLSRYVTLLGGLASDFGAKGVQATLNSAVAEGWQADGRRPSGPTDDEGRAAHSYWGWKDRHHDVAEQSVRASQWHPQCRPSLRE